MVFIQLSDHDGFESHYDDGDNVCNMDGFSVMHLNLSAHCGLCWSCTGQFGFSTSSPGICQSRLQVAICPATQDFILAKVEIVLQTVKWADGSQNYFPSAMPTIDQK